MTESEEKIIRAVMRCVGVVEIRPGIKQDPVTNWVSVTENGKMYAFVIHNTEPLLELMSEEQK